MVILSQTLPEQQETVSECFVGAHQTDGSWSDWAKEVCKNLSVTGEKFVRRFLRSPYQGAESRPVGTTIPLTPFLARKGAEIVSEGHPFDRLRAGSQAAGNPESWGLHTPNAISLLGGLSITWCAVIS